MSSHAVWRRLARIFTLLLLTVLGPVALSGCATIVEGSDQDVAVTTPGAAGAMCTFSSPEIGSQQVRTPGHVTLDKSKHDVQVRCEKPGYEVAEAMLPSHFQSMTLGNMLIGGIIGVGIDAASGAMNEYQESIQVRMIPLPESTPDAPDRNVPLPPQRRRNEELSDQIVRRSGEAHETKHTAATPGSERSHGLGPMFSGASVLRSDAAGGDNGGQVLYRLKFGNDGSLKGILHNGGTSASQADTGSWSVRGRELCTEWNNWDDGAQHCYTIARAGDGYEAIGDGRVLKGRFRITRGAAEAKPFAAMPTAQPSMKN